MSKAGIGHYFLERGITPDVLTERLEFLKPTEREVLLARAAGESLRSIGRRMSLTAEGVRYIETQAVERITSQTQSDMFAAARSSLEKQYGRPLEELLEGLDDTEREVLIRYAGGEAMADIAMSTKVSIAHAVRVRDEVLARLKGTSSWMTREDEWEVMKTTVERVLKEQPMSYAELIALLEISQTRLSRLMNEMVREGRADVSDTIPLRFLSKS